MTEAGGRPKRRRWMFAGLCWATAGVVVVLGALLFLSDRWLTPALDDADLARVGERFFRNECGRDPDKLTHWNRGEAFISLGILHMLWYPAGVTQTYRETFPDFVDFCRRRGQAVPAWIEDALDTGCPWPDRASFYAQFDSGLARSLRSFLGGTQGLQAAFAQRRLRTGLKQVVAQAPAARRLPLRAKLYLLGRSPAGVYALIDYVNFKGEGTSAKERYQGQGWGLAQVLAGMPLTGSSREALAAFVQAAKETLSRRVANAPDPVKERRWLPGWHKRLDRYLAPITDLSD